MMLFVVRPRSSTLSRRSAQTPEHQSSSAASIVTALRLNTRLAMGKAMSRPRSAMGLLQYMLFWSAGNENQFTHHIDSLDYRARPWNSVSAKSVNAHASWKV